MALFLQESEVAIANDRNSIEVIWREIYTNRWFPKHIYVQKVDAGKDVGL